MTARLAIALTILAAPAMANCQHCRTYPRNPEIPREFAASVPCPSTGAVGTSCPGYVVDHAVPLCAGGADALGNVWWERADRARRKDGYEMALCRSLRRVERRGGDAGPAWQRYRERVAAMGGDEARDVDGR